MGLVTVRDLSPLSPFRAQHFPVAQLLNPGKTLTQDIDELRLRALSILSPQQQHLGRVLLEIQDLDGERNILHHPPPRPQHRVGPDANLAQQRSLPNATRVS